MSKTTKEKSPVLQFRGVVNVNSQAPTKDSNKISLKPPKYGYTANILPKTSNIDSILSIKKIIPNPNPGETTGIKIQTSTKTNEKQEKTHDKNKENQPLISRSEVEEEEEEVTSSTTSSEVIGEENNEKNSIIDLRQRLKNLKNQYQNEIGSYDFGSNEEGEEEDEEEEEGDVNEIEIINESDDNEGEETLKSSKTFSIEEKQHKKDGNDKAKLLSDSTLSLAKHLNHLSIESLDLKTKKLIEKSESTMSKLISSDGLTSSSQSTATSSTVSTDFQPPEVVYKPEFVKFLDNQLKPSSAPLKPEEDILYQWRLRRKIEEAQKEANSNTNKNLIIQIPTSYQSQSLPSTTSSSSQQQQSIVKPISNKTEIPASVKTITPPLPSPSPAQTSKKTTPLISTETQTVEKVDLATQTSIETVTINKPKVNEKEDEKKPASVVVKKPSGFRSSSPKRKQFESPSPLVNNSTTNDLTKVSELISPLSTAPSQLLQHQNKFPATSASFASSISSMTNITSRTASPRSSRDDLVDKPNNQVAVKESANRIEPQNDDAVFESDEILQILFKKKYFYQMKMKQIDELLLKS